MEAKSPHNIKQNITASEKLFSPLSDLKNAFRQINKLCMKVCGASASLVNIVDDNYQYTITKQGEWKWSRIPVEKSICAKTIKRGKLLIIDDVKSHELTRQMFKKDEMSIRFYAGVPLRNAKKEIIATFCFICYAPKKLDNDTKHSFLLMAEHLQELVRTYDIQELKISNLQEQIESDVNENEVILLEINHRLKNNLADICGMIQLERAEAEYVEMREVLTRIESRISTAVKLHELLYKSKSRGQQNLEAYIKQLIEKIIKVSKPDKLELSCELNIENIYLEFTYLFPLGLIVNELVTNALQHAFVNRNAGKVKVDFNRVEGDAIRLKIRDNGNGLKNSNRDSAATHLGNRIVELLANQIKAKIKYEQEAGTSFELVFTPKKIIEKDNTTSQKKITKNYLPLHN